MPSFLSYFILWISTLLVEVTSDSSLDYAQQVKPILKERCYACHGALKQEGNLRLDTAKSILAGGASGPAIQPGDAAASLLIARVLAKNEEDRMPPRHEGETLTEFQIDALKRWIQSGASAPPEEQSDTDPESHWAFQSIEYPEIPSIDLNWSKNPIDAFVQRGHSNLGITPQPEASRIVLLRRLYFDLVGIPPTLEEIQECESGSDENWYEHAVDRLLADPKYGERWARHWMDIWRYSDWWGLGDQLRNSQKHIWHWRDWIIESLNDDLPYDEMLRQMLAADELYPGDLSKLRATGYLARNYWLFNRPQWMDETVEHVSKGMLGLTMNCARCHDHKYDPIVQTDYYRLRAFFEPYHVRLDMVPGESDLAQDGIPRVFDGVLDEPTYLYIRGDERNPDKSASIPPSLPSFLSRGPMDIQSVVLPAEAWQPERRPWVFDAYIRTAREKVTSAERKVRQLQQKLESLKKEGKADVEAGSESTASEKSNNEANLELAEAEAAWVEVKHDLDSLLLRAEAQRDEWSSSQSSLGDKSRAAIRSERIANLSRAQHRVTSAELAYHRANANKKADAEKKRTEAREAVAAAQKLLDTEISDNDRFTLMVGARWTPTRFLNSGKDDPEVSFPKTSTGRRTALARWIASNKNPLTARVAVNHIWTRHFGQPLVPTVFDFGRKGTPPTHPELLDWLAAEFMESGWSMKHLHSLILKSSTYRLSSSMADNRVATEKDPENASWWRRLPQRMESQSVRDALLAISRNLDFRIGGPSISSNQQPTSPRRSLYFFHSNNDRNLFLTQFDEALVKDCYRREQSIVPQQALALINSQLSIDTAQQLEKILSREGVDDERFVQLAFRLIVGIDPSQHECKASLDALQVWKNRPQGSDALARRNLVWTLINHNDFVTLR